MFCLNLIKILSLVLLTNFKFIRFECFEDLTEFRGF